MRRLKRKFELHEPGFNAAVSAALRLREHGFAAGLVGGSVRDLLLGKVPSDFDLVTSAKPEELAQLFADFRAVGASFGVSLIGVGGVSLEVATAREERNYLDVYKYDRQGENSLPPFRRGEQVSVVDCHVEESQTTV